MGQVEKIARTLENLVGKDLGRPNWSRSIPLPWGDSFTTVELWWSVTHGNDIHARIHDEKGTPVIVVERKEYKTPRAAANVLRRMAAERLAKYPRFITRHFKGSATRVLQRWMKARLS